MSPNDPEPEPAVTTPARTDRRQHDLPPWHPRRLRGRRIKLRRAEEHDQPYLVDRVGARHFALAAAMLILTLVDGVFTVLLLERGCVEANPVMQYLLDHGTLAFFAGKYALTAVFLPVALVMNQYRLFGSRLRVGHFVPLVVALYALLIVYQIGLWRMSGEQAEAYRRHPTKWSTAADTASFSPEARPSTFRDRPT